MKTFLNLCTVLILIFSTPLSILAQKTVNIRNAKSLNDKDAKGNIIQNNVWDNLGVLMLNLFNDKSTPVWLFEAGTTLEENKTDGVARIKGSIVQFGRSKRRFALDMKLSSRRNTFDEFNPPYGFFENSSDKNWYYYDTVEGSLTGLDELVGGLLTLEIDDNRPSFQLGDGANQIAQDGNAYGAAGWFKWTVNKNLGGSLKLQDFPKRSPYLDRGGIHFLTDPPPVDCYTGEGEAFSVKDVTCNACGSSIPYSGFFVNAPVINNDPPLDICTDTRLNVVPQFFQESRVVIDPMTDPIEIKSITFRDNNNTNYIFNLKGIPKTTPNPDVQVPCDRQLNTISNFTMSGTINIDSSGNSTEVTVEDNSFIQYGTVQNSPNTKGLFGVIYFTYRGIKKAIEFVNELEQVPSCGATPIAQTSRAVQLDFFANANNGDARLEWVNNTGDKNDYFVVQKLDETGEFKDIETINAEFTGNYKYFATYDRQITEGDNIYRLKLVFNNKSYKYSEIQTLQFDERKNVYISPNPADDNIQIDVKNYQNTPVSVFIYNTFGKTVLSHINGNTALNAIYLDTSTLQTGEYIVRVVAQNKRDILQKIMIVR